MLGKLLSIIAPKKIKPSGSGSTGTFNAAAPQNVLGIPQYRDHLQDVFASRASDDSRALMKQLFRFDPDVSATVNVNLTMANTEPMIIVRDIQGEIDREETRNLMTDLARIFNVTDYTLGFQLKPGLTTICENLRYMAMLRGALAAELIYDKAQLPSEIRILDSSSFEWFEKASNQYKPQQRPPGSTTPISLDIPTLFVSFFRRDPTGIYTYSSFVSAINTIASRQQVVNDLYRIMQITGYPRMDVKVLQEVMTNAAPASVKTDPEKLKVWARERLNEVREAFTNVRADQALIHWDSVEATILNDKNPGMAIDISAVIEVLNSQNQAALKTMATVIGRGDKGAGVATIEARIAAMNADELNEPLAELLSKMFSFILHQRGYQGYAYVTFKKVELRADLELEPQLMLRSSRLLTDLSHGLITDDEYHLHMYNRLRPDSAPELSGTKFMVAEGIDASKASPNDDPMARSLTPEGSPAAKSNGVKSNKTKSRNP